MSGELMLHCGGKPASRLDLAEVITPGQTDTYMPVPHLDLVEKVDGIARELLHRDLARESFGLNCNGQRMFGVLTYKNGEDEDMGLSIGIRNSYDQSMSIGVASRRYSMRSGSIFMMRQQVASTAAGSAPATRTPAGLGVP